MTEELAISGTPDPKSGNSFNKYPFAGVMAFVLLMVGIGFFLLEQSRNQYDQRAATTTQNLARVLNKNLVVSFSKVDVAILAVADEAKRQLAAGAIQKEAFNRFIMREHSRLAELAVFRATDVSGNAIYGAQARPSISTSLAQWDYFRRLKGAPDAGLVISKPLVGGISGKWMIVLARWINYGRLWELA